MSESEEKAPVQVTGAFPKGEAEVFQSQWQHSVVKRVEKCLRLSNHFWLYSLDWLAIGQLKKTKLSIKVKRMYLFLMAQLGIFDLWGFKILLNRSYFSAFVFFCILNYFRWILWRQRFPRKMIYQADVISLNSTLTPSFQMHCNAANSWT